MRCPACGTPAKPGARFCRQCGKNLGQSAEPSYAPAVPPPSPARMLALDDKLDRLQRYLPSHLSEKILGGNSLAQGEDGILVALPPECRLQYDHAISVGRSLLPVV